MIILDTTTRNIEIALGATPITNNLPVVANWVDYNPSGGTYTPASGNFAASLTSGTTITNTPTSGHIIHVKYFTVYNADTVPAVVTIQYDDNGTIRKIWKGTLQVNDTLQYIDARGFQVIDTNGNVKTVAASGNLLVNSFFGGRLTLTSGTPITTGDVTGATSIYYTYYTGDYVTLWTGTAWTDILFTNNTQLALGTLTNATLYYVYGYLSSSALALEASTTSATIQDGLYCKSSDHSRVLLGIFYTTATTTTEDSAAKRYLINMYNRVPKNAESTDGTQRSTTSTTYVQIDTVQINFLALPGDFVQTIGYTVGANTAGQDVFVTIGSGTTTEATGAVSGGMGASGSIAAAATAQLAESFSSATQVTRYFLFKGTGGVSAFVTSGSGTSTGLVAIINC